MPLFAQNDVTRFLGIPVDGFKSDMIQKLKDKGFVESGDGTLSGEFNGRDVYVSVVTNNNKVCRIMLSDKFKVDETDIKIRFNKLCRQFQNNNKYMSFSLEDQMIPDEEDIAYEMSVKNKRYEAVFCQQPLQMDTVALQNKVRQQVLQKYTQEQIDSQSEDVNEYIQKIAFDVTLDWYMKKPVWFYIDKFGGKYYIVMYYDNEYNRANGEDL